MWAGRSRLVAGLVVLCFWAGTIEAAEQGEIYGWGSLKLPKGPLVDVSQIAAGWEHSLALKSDGSIFGWGRDRYGQMTTMPGGNDFTAIAAGEDYSLALKSDGSIVGWGSNNYGQVTTMPGGNDFTAIATGGYHSLALKSDGSIVAWGGNGDYGQTTVPEGNDFVAIAAGRFHSLAIKSDGSIVAWGRNISGETTMPEGNDFVAIAAGWYHNLALKSNGSIVGWGAGEPGETGWQDFGQASVPEGNDFVAIAAGGFHSLALKSDGSIVAWGNNAYGQASGPEGSDFVAIATGGLHSLAIKSDGSVVAWGNNAHGQATVPEGGGDGNDFVTIAAGSYHNLAIKSDGSVVAWGNNWSGQATEPEGGGNDFAAIAAGYAHSLALKSDGSIIAWGNNAHGQATAPAGNDFVAIAAGYYHSLALKSDGSVVGWGNNDNGQVTVPAGNDFVAIAAGGYHSLALKSDGSVVGWGDDTSGQATVPAGNDFVAIAAGGYHSLALKSDGSIVGWGRNYSGQASGPEGNDFVAIAAGGAHSLALKSDGSVVGWGWNDDGQMTVPTGNDFIAIAAGWYHSLAIKYVSLMDVNRDHRVDLADFGIVSAGWMEGDCYGDNNFCSGADIDQMGDVGLGDLLILAERWLEGVCFSVPAFAPDPADGAPDVNTRMELRWSAEECAVSHNIYFGTSSPGVFQRNQPGTRFNPGPLDCQTTYYWRIDEVQADSSVIEGDVWRFTTIPVSLAVGPDPADGASDVNTGLELSWSAGGCAVSHNIYFGTSSPGEFQRNQPGTTFNPGPLDLGTMYYWRIDEVQADSSVIEGDVWMFTTRSEMFVGWWELDESEGGTAYDSVGGHDGTLNGDPTWWPSGGKIGGALEFDGVGDYVEVAGYKGISGSNPRTVTAWVRVESNGSGLSIVRWGTLEINGGLWSNVINAAGNLRVAVWGGSVVGGTVINDNTWHHVAIVLPDKWDVKVEDILLYVDGEQEYTTIDYGTQPIDTAVGMDVLISSDGSDGLLDDVRIYNYALSTGEIRTLAGFPPELVAHWKLDESSGTMALDSSGKENHGTLHGNPTWRPSGGKIDGALEFDGYGYWYVYEYWYYDCVEVEGYKGISGPNPRTITAWVRTESNESNESNFSIVRWGTEEIGALWSNVIDAEGKLRAAVYGGSIVGSTDIDDNAWHHVAIVLPDKGDVKVEDILLYVDGVQEDATITNGAQIINTAVGENVFMVYDSSDGLLDDVRIYNYALSEEEIRGLDGVLSALGPDPADGASGVNPDTELSWSAGGCAVSHNIYFGTSSPGEFRGNQTETTFNPGLLDCGTTYYWRINEVQADSSVIEGDVWKFTTAPASAAFGPSPTDGASGVNPDTELSWSAGSGAISHDVYFGTSSPGVFQCNQTGTTFDIGPLDLETMYYWRIDEVGPDSSVIEGDVWRFTTSSDLPVGWWELDEIEGGMAYDSSVGGHDGTLMGDPVWWPSDGKIGGALEFDGNGDYVEVAGYKGISGSNPRTVSAWVKVESTGSTFSIVRWGTLEISGGLWSNVINAAGNLRAAVIGGSVVGDTTINDDTWHHVAIVLPDKEDVKVEDILLYVDGEPEDTTISLGSQTINTAVGMDVLISLDGSVGLLDDVRIYNYALSEEEIGALAGVL